MHRIPALTGALVLTLALAISAPATAYIFLPQPVAPDLIRVSQHDSNQQIQKIRRIKEARKRAHKRKERARRNAKRMEGLGNSFGKTRLRVKKLSNKLKTEGESVAETTDSGIRAEVKKIRKDGGDYFVEQAEYAAVSDGIEAIENDQNIDPKDRARQLEKLNKRREASAKKLRKIRTDAGDVIAGLQAIDIAEAGGALDTRMKVKRRLLRKRLKDLGGDLEVEAYDIGTEHERLSQEAGLPPQSPMAEGYIPLSAVADIDVGEVIAQGKDPVCGVAAASMAASSRGCKAVFKKMLSDLTDSGVLKGTNPDVLAGVISDRLPFSARNRRFGKPNRAKQLQEAFDNPDQGPMVIGINNNTRFRLAADAVRPELTSVYKLPDGVGPSLTQTGQLAMGLSAYHHWVAVDGVISADSGNGPEPHFIVRDSQNGQAYLYTVGDFEKVFDGNAIELTAAGG